MTGGKCQDMLRSASPVDPVLAMLMDRHWASADPRAAESGRLSACECDSFGPVCIRLCDFAIVRACDAELLRAVPSYSACNILVRFPRYFKR